MATSNPDDIYELALPTLQDDGIEEEEKTDKLEELLAKETSLTGRALDDAILSALWRYRNSKAPVGTASPARPPLNRRNSPAPWQSTISRSSTPSALTSPPLACVSPVVSYMRPGMSRTKSSTLSPFTSPRPSPRLAFATPIPHSPSLSSYEFHETGLKPVDAEDDYGNYGSDAVDWLVSDSGQDVYNSRPSSSAGSAYGGGGSSLSAAAPAWVNTSSSATAQETNMSPYDMLRSVLGETKSDEDIEQALMQNEYDLSATLIALMGTSGIYEEGGQVAHEAGNTGAVIVGKSMLATPPISIEKAGQRINTVCKYWLASGECLRADCRFSHDVNAHLCKYWLMGNCLAGSSCLYSHDPASLISTLNIDPSTSPSPSPSFQAQVQDYDAFPTLQPWQHSQGNTPTRNNNGTGYPHNNRAFIIGAQHRNFPSIGSSPRSQNSRPTSRHSSRPTTPSHFSVDDAEAFPTLGSGSKGGKKHHGKRGGHGHHNNNGQLSKENQSPVSLADFLRLCPAPAPGLLRKGLVRSAPKVGDGGGLGGGGTDSAAAKAIPEPKHIPWMDTGEKANQAYMKARQDAFKHGGLRNKFLQSAAQAWNRNDARAAKALSLRGQSENEQMRRAHREAARILYEERNKTSPQADPSSPKSELYVDLHGLHPEEAVEYLERVLLEQKGSSRPVYAITGTGHHSKNGKDKVGKAVRMWLGEWKYAFREFSVPGDRGNVGGILGVDPRSFDRSILEKSDQVGSEPEETGVSTKVRVLKDVPTGPRVRA